MKLNKLLPIVALSGIATVAMPLVTSCGPKGGDTPEKGPWDDFNEPESGVYVSKLTYDMKNGQQYIGSWHFGEKPEKNSVGAVGFFITDSTTLGAGQFYDVVNKTNLSLKINEQDVEADRTEEQGTPFVYANWDDSYYGKDFTFTVKCVTDFPNAYLHVRLM